MSHVTTLHGQQVSLDATLSQHIPPHSRHYLTSKLLDFISSFTLHPYRAVCGKPLVVTGFDFYDYSLTSDLEKLFSKFMRWIFVPSFIQIRPLSSHTKQVLTENGHLMHERMDNGLTDRQPKNTMLSAYYSLALRQWQLRQVITISSQIPTLTPSFCSTARL